MTRLVAIPFVVATAACSLINKPGASAGGSEAPPSSTGRSSLPATADKAAAPAGPEVPIPPVPEAAAHPTVAWFVKRAAVFPGYALGGTGHASVPPGVVMTFALDRAMFDIAPACLRDYGLPKTAAKLGKVAAIKDKAGLDAAKLAIDEIKPSAEEELQGKDFSDRSNGSGAATAVSEALTQLFDETTLAIDDGNRALGADTLAGWLGVLDVCFDTTQIGVVERNLGAYIALLETGKPPARSKKYPTRHVHPAVETLLRRMSTDVSLAELSAILAIDFSDTLRGKNLDVALYASNLAVHELAPKYLTQCGAGPAAEKIAKLPSFKNQAEFDKVLTTVMDIKADDQQANFCLGAMQNLVGSVVSEASDALSYLRQDINSHPSYARGALVGWASFLSEMNKIPEAERAEYTLDLLTRAVKKLKSMPRRKETSREPE